MEIYNNYFNWPFNIIFQKFLLQLYHRLNEIEGVVSESGASTSAGNGEPQDELDLYISAFFEEDDIPTGVSHSVDEAVISQIKELEIREKVPIIVPADGSDQHVPFDLLKYWESQKITSPILYRLAMVVLMAPSTQVSVERAFSGLKLILTDYRMRLTENSVENLLVLKLNLDLLEKVAEVLSNEAEMS